MENTIRNCVTACEAGNEIEILAHGSADIT